MRISYIGIVRASANDFRNTKDVHRRSSARSDRWIPNARYRRVEMYNTRTGRAARV